MWVRVLSSWWMNISSTTCREEPRLQLHRPVRRNVALVTGEPWEGNASFYRTVLQDGSAYRMYYGTWHYETTETGQTYPHRQYLCYAESSDGIRFRKPKLGLVEFRGSTDNNIVLSETTLSSVEADPGHAAIFIDDNPDCPEDARYKMIIRSNGEKGLLALKSPDGLRFTPMSDRVVISEGAFDSQNLAFWDPVRREYRAYFRGFRQKVRDILTATLLPISSPGRTRSGASIRRHPRSISTPTSCAPTTGRPTSWWAFPCATRIGAPPKRLGACRAGKLGSTGRRSPNATGRP